MLFRILLPLLILLVVPTLTIDRLYLRGNYHRRWRIALWLPVVLLGPLLIFTGLNESYTPASAEWKGFLLSMALLFIVPETLAALLLGLGIPAERIWPQWKEKIRAVTRRMAMGTGLVFFAAMLFGLTFGYRNITVRSFTYTHPEVPKAFEGYRIIHISDLHLGTLAGKKDVVKRLVDSINAQHPDLVVFTGDLVNYHPDEIDEFHTILRQITTRDGVVSVMGNHDYLTYHHWETPADSAAAVTALQEKERALGWKLLLNAHHIIRHGADSLVVVGVENDGCPPFPAYGDLGKARRGLDKGCFSILLSHDPTHWKRKVLPDTDIPLTLSGHTHGMQLKIGTFSPASWFYKEWGGDYISEDGRTLYVSLGAGQVLIPFRLGAWPEMTLITLRRGNPSTH